MTTTTRPYQFISHSDNDGFIISLVNDPFEGISVELSDFELNDDKLSFNFNVLDDISESLHKQLTKEIENVINFILNASIELLKDNN